MSVLLKTIQFFDKSDVNNERAVTIIDDTRTNVKISMKNKSSGMEITLKNINGEHVGSDGVFKWNEQDTVKIFLKYTDDTTYSIDTSASTDLIMTGEIQEYEAELGENDTSWKVKIVDKSYILLNKLWAKAYLKTDTHDVKGVEKTGWTSPELIRDIITAVTARGNKTSEVKADLAIGTYDSDGKFTRTSGGYIQNIRPDSSTFESLRAELSIGKVFKPVYEWINDLGSIERTNTASEQTGTLICKRPYMYYIDEDNNFHWEYPGTATTTYLMTVGSTAAVGEVTVYDTLQEKNITYTDNIYHRIIGGKLKKGVFDVINMVIYNAGDDYDGSGVLDYFYNPNTKSPTLKPVYKPFTDIAKRWKSEELIRGLNTAPVDYTLNNDTGTLLVEGRKYDASFNFKPVWDDGSGDSEVTSDATLNASLRAKCIVDGDSRSEDITNERANARYKGTIQLKGYNYRVGNVIIFNDSFHGIVNEFLRITDVQHSINKDGWFVTLNVENDAEKRE